MPTIDLGKALAKLEAAVALLSDIHEELGGASEAEEEEATKKNCQHPERLRMKAAVMGRPGFVCRACGAVVYLEGSNGGDTITQ